MIVLREAKLASSLDHPNIANIHEIGEHDGGLYIAMSLYEGENVRERMGRGPLSVAEIEAILEQLLTQDQSSKLVNY